MSTEKMKAEISNEMKCSQCESLNLVVREITLLVDHGCRDCANVKVLKIRQFLSGK